jgi:hypothetical protein
MELAGALRKSGQRTNAIRLGLHLRRGDFRFSVADCFLLDTDNDLLSEHADRSFIESRVIHEKQPANK